MRDLGLYDLTGRDMRFDALAKELDEVLTKHDATVQAESVTDYDGHTYGYKWTVTIDGEQRELSDLLDLSDQFSWE